MNIVPGSIKTWRRPQEGCHPCKSGNRQSKLKCIPEAGESLVTKRALVIGGGIAGIQTALDIAEAGYEVDIVEKTPVSEEGCHSLTRPFPTLDVPHVS